jgi:hypothetical protein
MSSLGHKRVVSQYIEQVVNTGDLDAMEKFVANNIVDHNAPPDAATVVYTKLPGR